MANRRIVAQLATTDRDGIDESTFVVVAWRDPVVEGMPGAIPTASEEVLVWWTPGVGPTGMVMAHRFAAYAAGGPTCWTVADISATFGIGGNTNRLAHTLTRLERFGIVTCREGEIAVRLMLAPLAQRQRACLPGYLGAALGD